MKTFLWVTVIITCIVIITFTLGDPVLRDVNNRYEELLKDLPDGMEKLNRRTVLTGFREQYGELGYNVSKGDEIGLCLDGNANEVFHVLIHELAHTVTKSYQHNAEFWDNFKQLKEHCINKKLYIPIDKKTEFCGKFIRD